MALAVEPPETVEGTKEEVEADDTIAADDANNDEEEDEDADADDDEKVEEPGWVEPNSAAVVAVAAEVPLVTSLNHDIDDITEGVEGKDDENDEEKDGDEDDGKEEWEEVDGEDGIIKFRRLVEKCWYCWWRFRLWWW